MKYSIIVPFYNEEKNVFLLNEEINKAINSIIKDSTREFEIIYVDDGSKDKTYETLNKNNIKVANWSKINNIKPNNINLNFSSFSNSIFLIT